MTEKQHSLSLPIDGVSPADSGLWSPATGHEWNSLVQRLSRPNGKLSATAALQLESDCRSILSRCSPPQTPADEPRTGLVLGQVQSGKTMSFTGVATLARDNGVRLVIVITGISSQLLEQSVQRLRRDLGIEQGSQSGWVHVPVEPTAQEPAARAALLYAN